MEALVQDLKQERDQLKAEAGSSALTPTYLPDLSDSAVLQRRDVATLQPALPPLNMAPAVALSRRADVEAIAPEALEQMRGHLVLSDADFEVARVEQKKLDVMLWRGELPFMIAESIIIKLVAKGASRQEAHEEIRVLSHQAGSVMKNEGEPNDLVEGIKATEFFKPIWGELDGMLRAELHTGRSVEIVERFCGVGGVLDKKIQPYKAYIENLTLWEEVPIQVMVHKKATPTRHATADVKLSKSSLTLGPGQSATVDVSAADPPGLDPKRLPVWSGWIAVSGSDGKTLTVPYLGLGGSLRSATVIEPSERNTIPEYWRFYLPDPPSGQKHGLSNTIKEYMAAVPKPWQKIWFRFNLALGLPQVRLDIVPLDICPSANDTLPPPLDPGRARPGRPSERGDMEAAPNLSKACVPDSMITEFGGVKSIGQLAGYPQHFMYATKRHMDIEAEWTGAYAAGQYAPRGKYKIVARALAIMGDANNASDWQTVESPVFSIAYMRGLDRGNPR
ncbi:Subtilisin-like serine protease PR1C [Tolypocladium paradoxum]|uniref:Subtilisin-like serine protease PR1C n=1 Tax=Tolypocladium paradoxum TaxID=94208 RepID=A0A2S4L5V7_9HYPO|nr:Subtilisin-like serine protease PR1C [Tolypocladium paradoxum]